MTTEKDLAHWDRMSAGYDGHVSSRDGLAVVPALVADVGDAARILDLGTGTGRFALALAREGREVLGLDPSPGMIAVARSKAAATGAKGVRFEVRDGCATGEPDASFDAVVLANVLHVLDEPKGALAEARRVLKPGGRLFAPTFCHAQGLKAQVLSRLSALLFGLPIHHRWSFDSLAALVREAGFEPVKREPWPGKVPMLYLVAR